MSINSLFKVMPKHLNQTQVQTMFDCSYDVHFMKCCVSFTPNVVGPFQKSPAFVSSLHRIFSQKCDKCATN